MTLQEMGATLTLHGWIPIEVADSWAGAYRGSTTELVHVNFYAVGQPHEVFYHAQYLDEKQVRESVCIALPDGWDLIRGITKIFNYIEKKGILCPTN